MKAAAVALAMVAASSASSAAAGEPVYFHKAGVERDAFTADLAYCLELARGVDAPPSPYVYTPNLIAVGVVSFLNGMMRSRERRHMIDSVVRTCMADKGYRRVEATKAIGKELEKLPEKERVERFYTFAAAPEPQGKLLPR